MQPFSAIKNRFLSLSTGQKLVAIGAPVGSVASTIWIFSTNPSSVFSPSNIALTLSFYGCLRAWLLAKPGREEELEQRAAKKEIAQREKEENQNREKAPMLTRICIAGGTGLSLIFPLAYDAANSNLPADMAEGAQMIIGSIVLIPAGVMVGNAVNGIVKGTMRMAKILTRQSAIPLSL